MSKLNKKSVNPALNGVAVSANGNIQFSKGAEQELYELAVSTLYGNDQFYESTSDLVKRMEVAMIKVVQTGNLDFIGNLITYARTSMHIRTMPIIMAVTFAKVLREQKKSYASLRTVVRDVIQRADQITDMYAAALDTFGSQLPVKRRKNLVPLAIKHGVADACNSFSEYQFAKYNTAGAVKLSDVLRIVHPVAKDEEQAVLFNKIMAGSDSTRTEKLEVPYTWEVELSRNGQLPESERKSSKQLWTELVKSGQVGYMAMLRNLRNINQAKLDSSVMSEYVYDFIADKENVRKSKQFPFAFMNAYEAVERLGDSKLLSAISKAMDASVGNLPALGNNTWIIIDCSGSMSWGHSVNQPIKTACLFAAALAKANSGADNMKLTMFSDSAEMVGINTDDSIITITGRLMDKVYGGGTNLQAALNQKKNLGFEPDTCVVLSDMEVTSLDSRQAASDVFSDNCVKVAINLAGGNSTPLDVRLGWYQISGWSDRIFDFIPAIRYKVSVSDVLSRPYMGLKAIRQMNVGEMIANMTAERA